MQERIKQLMESQHMNQQSFANLTHISPATLSSIFKGRTQPTLPHVLAIQKCFPNINLQWLLHGTGVMFPPTGSVDSSSLSSEQSVQQNVSSFSTDKMTEASLPFADDDVQEDNASQQVSAPSSSTTQRSHQQPNSVNQHQNAGYHQQYSGHLQQSTSYQSQGGYNNGMPMGALQGVGIVAGHQRKITEIRVFYDDQTYESFYPKK